MQRCRFRDILIGVTPIPEPDVRAELDRILAIKGFPSRRPPQQAAALRRREDARGRNRSAEGVRGRRRSVRARRASTIRGSIRSSASKLAGCAAGSTSTTTAKARPHRFASACPRAATPLNSTRAAKQHQRPGGTAPAAPGTAGREIARDDSARGRADHRDRRDGVLARQPRSPSADPICGRPRRCCRSKRT